jgi:hypothetical protein
MELDTDDEWINPEDLEFAEIDNNRLLESSTIPGLQSYTFDNESLDPPIVITTPLYPPLEGGDRSGIKLFPSSIVLADVILMSSAIRSIRERAKKVDILELGAGGTGLPSIVACRMMKPNLGANNSTVIATDHDPTCLAFLRQNVEVNSTETESAIRVVDYSWSSVSLPQGFTPEGADLILASEVLYDGVDIGLLVGTIKRCAKKRTGGEGGGGVVVITLPLIARVSPQKVGEFDDKMANSCFLVVGTPDSRTGIDGETYVTTIWENEK